MNMYFTFYLKIKLCDMNLKKIKIILIYKKLTINYL